VHWIVLNTRPLHKVIGKTYTSLSYFEPRFLSFCNAESLVDYLSYYATLSVWKRLSISLLTLNYDKNSLRREWFILSPYRRNERSGQIWDMWTCTILLNSGKKFINLGFTIKSVSRPSVTVDYSASLTSTTTKCSNGSLFCW